jgi:hypothetical protein
MSELLVVPARAKLSRRSIACRMHVGVDVSQFFVFFFDLDLQ